MLTMLFLSVYGFFFFVCCGWLVVFCFFGGGGLYFFWKFLGERGKLYNRVNLITGGACTERCRGWTPAVYDVCCIAPSDAQSAVTAVPAWRGKKRMRSFQSCIKLRKKIFCFSRCSRECYVQVMPGHSPAMTGVVKKKNWYGTNQTLRVLMAVETLLQCIHAICSVPTWNDLWIICCHKLVALFALCMCVCACVFA